MTAPDDEVEAIKGIAADVTADYEEKVAADERERARDYAASRNSAGLLLQLIKDCTDAENKQDAFQARQARLNKNLRPPWRLGHPWGGS